MQIIELLDLEFLKQPWLHQLSSKLCHDISEKLCLSRINFIYIHPITMEKHEHITCG